jgi:hypothetical protein
VQDEEEEPDPVKYHIFQLKRLSKQYPASRVLWKALFGVLCQQGSGYTVSDVRACCVDAVRALSKHAERIRITAPTMHNAVHDLGAAHTEQWMAECAAVEAVSRHVDLEMSSGHISEALVLLQCVCEFFSCPRESCVLPLSPFITLPWGRHGARGRFFMSHFTFLASFHEPER